MRTHEPRHEHHASCYTIHAFDGLCCLFLFSNTLYIDHPPLSQVMAIMYCIVRTSVIHTLYPHASSRASISVIWQNILCIQTVASTCIHDTVTRTRRPCACCHLWLRLLPNCVAQQAQHGNIAELHATTIALAPMHNTYPSA